MTFFVYCGILLGQQYLIDNPDISLQYSIFIVASGKNGISIIKTESAINKNIILYDYKRYSLVKYNTTLNSIPTNLKKSPNNNLPIIIAPTIIKHNFIYKLKDYLLVLIVGSNRLLRLTCQSAAQRIKKLLQALNLQLEKRNLFK